MYLRYLLFELNACLNALWKPQRVLLGRKAKETIKDFVDQKNPFISGPYMWSFLKAPLNYPINPPPHPGCFRLKSHASECWRRVVGVPLAEGVQAGQYFWVVVVVEADAAHQELLVDLPHHRTGAPSLTLGHGERHSRDEDERPLAPLNLQRGRERETERENGFKTSFLTEFVILFC